MQADQLLDDLRIEYLRSGHHHCRDGWLQLKNCPYCGSNNYHLGLNLAGNYCVCWRCGGHSLFNTLLNFDVPFKKVQSLLGELGPELLKSRVQTTVGKLKEPNCRGAVHPAHRRYLRERGFGDDVIELWQLEGICMHPQLGWRIYIPIHHKGERVSWTARAIGDRVTQRYLSAASDQEKIPHKHLVYGLDFCRGSVVVVEGPADAWAIGPGAGALFGTAFTPEQVLLLASVPNRFICFDSETTAQARAKALAGQLAAFGGVTETWSISAKDPGSASKSEIKAIRRAAGLD